MPRLKQGDKSYELGPDEYEMYKFGCGKVDFEGAYPSFGVIPGPRMDLYNEYKRNGTLPEQYRYPWSAEEQRVGEIVKRAFGRIQDHRGQHFAAIKAELDKYNYLKAIEEKKQEVSNESETTVTANPRLG